MKKVLLLLVCLFTLQTVVWADDDKPIQVNQLPQTAQTFIFQLSGIFAPVFKSIIPDFYLSGGQCTDRCQKQ